MGKLSIGDVVFVAFPFSDLTNTKLRPAVILLDAERGDWVLCQITSKAYTDAQAIQLTEEHFSIGKLDLTSYVRPTKLFTANQEIIKKQVGRLHKTTYQVITLRIQALMDEALKQVG
jgi:mRNA interferase MazF